MVSYWLGLPTWRPLVGSPRFPGRAGRVLLSDTLYLEVYACAENNELQQLHILCQGFCLILLILFPL
jgi:hypothetical protein